LIAHDNHADIRIIESESGTLKIEQIRDMQHQLSLRPVEARYRIIILRRFHEATPQAMDALLKTLEEPAPYVMILLTADTADTLLPTIKSRCQPLSLRPISTSQVRRALEDNYNVESERAILLAQLSSGRMGWAVRAAADESLLEQRTELLAMLEQVIELPRVGRFTVAESLSKDKGVIATALELWQAYFRDVMLMIHNATTPLTNRDHRHFIQQIAVGAKVEDIQRAITAIQRTAEYIDANVNARLALEVMMLDLPRLKLYAPPPSHV
jgi:DNA polymerase-3 subunit delta'